MAILESSTICTNGFHNKYDQYSLGIECNGNIIQDTKYNGFNKIGSNFSVSGKVLPMIINMVPIPIDTKKSRNHVTINNNNRSNENCSLNANNTTSKITYTNK